MADTFTQPNAVPPSLEVSAKSMDGASLERDSHQWVQLVIRSVVLALSLLIWSIIGFFVWVPLLLRATVHMAGAVLYSTLLRKDTNRAAARLNHAMEFLPGGFARIFKAVNAGGTPDSAEDDSEPGLFEGLRAFLRIVLELAIALAFWFLLGALFRLWAMPELDRTLSLVAELYTSIRRILGL